MAEAKKRKPLVALKHEGKPLKGVLKYPRVNEPDTKFKKEGEYSTKVIISGEVAEAIKPQLEAVAKEALAEAKGKLEEKIASGKGEEKGKAKKKLAELKIAALPMKPVFNDDGDETGEFELHFKMNASYAKKTGEIVKIAPKFFTSKGVELKGKDKPQVWGGTVARVSADLQPWFMESTNEAGCKLRLSAIQILELKSGGGKDAAGHGFEAEDGYEPDESLQQSGKNEGGDAPQGGGDENEEF